MTPETISVEDLVNQGALWFAEQGTGQRATLARLFGAFAPADPRSRTSGAVPFGDPTIDGALPEGGLRSGALHEWLLPPESGGGLPPAAIFAAVAANAFKTAGCRKHLLWIGKQLWPTPFLLEEIFTALGVETEHPLQSCIFIEPPNRTLQLWCLETALRSPGVAAVVAQYDSGQLATSKRLALAAQAGGAIGLLFRSLPRAAALSAAASRWRVRPLPSASPNPVWQLELLKLKGEQPRETQWITEFKDGRLTAAAGTAAAPMREKSTAAAAGRSR